jgi:hypothetical protein
MVDADQGPGFKILVREDYSDVTYSLVIHHPGWASISNTEDIWRRLNIRSDNAGTRYHDDGRHHCRARC